MTVYVAHTRGDIDENRLQDLLSRIRQLPAAATTRRTRDGFLIVAWGASGPVLEAELTRSEYVTRVLPEGTSFPLAARAHRPEGSVVHVGSVPVGDGRPVIIAGPCSAETPEVLLETAHRVKAAGAAMLRVGIFKPRTSPYSFHGLGHIGLPLLREARAQTGLPIVTEILDARDIELVGDAADVLQVGARNMQNFSLLTELALTGRPVLLKRGMSASVHEWLNAAEYLLAHGNDNVILCERGIRTFERSTRFTLDLNAVPVVKELSHLPILVDPSHGTGATRYVPPMSAAALAAGADGLIVEVHPRPHEALSDGAQSLDLAQFDRFSADLRPLASALGREFVSTPELLAELS
ncbi:3-deoxy-7-phosphoheptulonate synthase [Nocardia kruczakiae]|uniref:3-deoxy-7-phosphoheptulonate synthase n=1 Tax=Nocardia kruczakiae TaxID=261477 RepID=UPI0007A3C246|nr:3-deoxy-7-phosphoheptulonate synthase [Nocardia kruczakiae]